MRYQIEGEQVITSNSYNKAIPRGNHIHFLHETSSKPSSARPHRPVQPIRHSLSRCPHIRNTDYPYDSSPAGRPRALTGLLGFVHTIRRGPQTLALTSPACEAFKLVSCTYRRCLCRRCIKVVSTLATISQNRVSSNYSPTKRRREIHRPKCP